MEKFMTMVGEMFGQATTNTIFPSATTQKPGFSWPTFIGGVVSALLATWVF